MVGFFVANTGVVADALAYPATTPYQNKNTPFRGYFYFWWESMNNFLATDFLGFLDIGCDIKIFLNKIRQI